LAAKESDGDTILCPSCSALVDSHARECPECGERLTGGAIGDPGAEKGSRLERILFYLGLGLVMVGGPGIAMGSWLHDVLSIPIGGDAFSVFGPLNRFVAIIGLVVLIVGIVVLIISIRLTRPVVDDDYDVGTPKRA
jgi:hypothetical protein